MHCFTLNAIRNAINQGIIAKTFKTGGSTIVHPPPETPKNGFEMMQNELSLKKY